MLFERIGFCKYPNNPNNLITGYTPLYTYVIYLYTSGQLNTRHKKLTAYSINSTLVQEWPSRRCRSTVPCLELGLRKQHSHEVDSELGRCIGDKFRSQHLSLICSFYPHLFPIWIPQPTSCEIRTCHYTSNFCNVVSVYNVLRMIYVLCMCNYTFLSRCRHADTNSSFAYKIVRLLIILYCANHRTFRYCRLCCSQRGYCTTGESFHL